MLHHKTHQLTKDLFFLWPPVPWTCSLKGLLQVVFASVIDLTLQALTQAPKYAGKQLTFLKIL